MTKVRLATKGTDTYLLGEDAAWSGGSGTLGGLVRDYGRQRPYRAVMDGLLPGPRQVGPTDQVFHQCACTLYLRERITSSSTKWLRGVSAPLVSTA